MSQKDEVERIVSMKFDNGQFEKGVSTSLKTIDQLKKSLDFSDAEKSLSGFQNAGKNFDVSGVISGIEKIESHFSLLGKFVDSIKDDIVGKVREIGSAIETAVAGTIKTGWGKYDQETAAVQTMMGNMTDADLEKYLLAQGKISELGKGQIASIAPDILEQDKIDYIESQLERLTWFADETSYSYNDMTSSLAKFIAAGAGIEDSTSAVQGLAVASADAGVNVKDASRAFYNFSQAIGSGYMRLTDWVSIETLTMATPKFKQNIIDTAVALGKLRDNADGTYSVLVKTAKPVEDFTVESMRNSLTVGRWFDTDVMLAVLKQYGSYADMIYAIQDEYDLPMVADAAAKIEELGIAYDETAKTGFFAAQNTKTFAEAIDFLKDALSTQFKGAFKTIFGGFLEARDLWSGFSEILYETLVVPMESMNDILTDWADTYGGRESFLAGLENGVKAIIRLMNLFGEAIRDAFPEMTGKRLYEFTERFREWTESLYLSDAAFEKLKTGISGVLKFIRSLFGLLKSIFSALKPALKTAANILTNVFSKLGGLLGKVADLDERLGGFPGEIKAINSAVGKFEKRLKELTGIDLHLPTLGDLIGKLKELTAKVKDLSGIDLHLPTWKEILDTLTQFKNKIEELTGIDFRLPTWEKFTDTIWNLVHQLENLTGIDIKMPTMDRIAERIAGLITTLAEFKDNLLGVKDGIEDAINPKINLTGWDKVRDIFDRIQERAAQIFSKKNKGTSIFSNLLPTEKADGFGEFQKKVAEIVAAIRGPISKITMEDILQVGLIGTLIRSVWNMASLFKSTSSVLKGLGSLLKSTGEGVKSMLKLFGGGWKKIGTGIKGFFDNLGTSTKAKTWKTRAVAWKDIGIAVALIAASIVLIAKFGKDTDIKSAIGIVAGITAFVLVASLLMDKLDQSGATGFTLYRSGNKGIFGVAAGIVLLLLSFRALKKYSAEELWHYFGIIAAMGGLLVALIDIGKIGGKAGIGSGAAFLLVAASLKTMVKVIDKIDGLELEQKKITLEVLAGIVLGMMVLMRSLNGVKFGGGFAAIGVAVALTAMIRMLKMLSELDMTSIRQNGGILALIGLALAVLIAISRIGNGTIIANAESAGKNIIKSRNSIAGIGISFFLIVMSMRVLDGVDFENIGSMLGSMALIFLGMIAVLAVAGQAGKYTNKAGRVLLSLSIAVGLMALVAGLMGSLKTETVIKGGAFVAALGLVFAAVIKAAGMYQKGVKSLTGLMICIGLLAAVVAALAWLQADGKDMTPIFGGMFALFLGFAVLIKMASGFRVGDIGALIGFTLMFGLIVGGLVMLLTQCTDLLEYDWKSILALFGGVSLILIAIAGAAKIVDSGGTSKWKDATGSLALVALFAVAAGGLMWELSKISGNLGDMSGIWTLIGATGALLAEIALLAGLVSLYKTTWKNALPSIAVIATLTAAAGGIMWAMTKFSDKIDPDGSVSLAISAGILLTAIGLVSAIAIVVGTAAKAAIIGAVVIGAFIVILAGVIALIGKVFSAETLEKGVTAFTLIGEAIGGFISGIIQKFREVKTGSLLKQAEDLSSYAEKIQGFGSLSELPEGLYDRIKDLKDAITEVKKIGNIKIKDPESITANLGIYLSAVGSLSEQLGGMDDTVYDRMANAGTFLSAISDSLKGLDIRDDIDVIGQKMADYGQHLVTFGSFAMMLPDGLLQKTKIAAGVLTEMATASKDIPNGTEDGRFNLFSFVMGDNDLDNFGTRMATYAQKLKEFSADVMGLPEGLEDKTGVAAAVLIKMADAAASIPNGSLDGKFNLWSFLAGDNDIDAFGEAMVTYATSLKEFSDIMAAVPARVEAQATHAANALTKLATAADLVPQGYGETFSAYNFFMGGKDAIENFGYNMVAFASSLGTFQTKMEDNVDAAKIRDNLDLLTDIFDTLAKPNLRDNQEIYGLSTAIKTLTESGLTTAVQTFAADTTTLGTSVLSFYELMENKIDKTAFGTDIGYIQTLIDTLKNVTKDDAKAVYDFGQALKKLAKQGIQEFVDTFANAKDDAQVAYESFMQYFVAGVEDPNTKLKLKMAFDAYLTGILTAVSSRYIDFYTSGKDCVQGFLNGMNAKLDEMVQDNPGIEVAEVVLNGIKGRKGLVIKSPSRAMREVGNYAIEGLIIGLKEELPSLEGISENLGETVKTGVQKVITTAVDWVKDNAGGLTDQVSETVGSMLGQIDEMANNGFDSTVEITPVLDLSTLKKQYGSEWETYANLFSGGTTASMVSTAVAKVPGLNSVQSELAAMRGELSQFRQAYMDDGGMDMEEIMAAIEEGAMRGTSEGLANTVITMDGKPVTTNVTNRQNSYERANGGHKVSAVWYR